MTEGVPHVQRCTERRSFGLGQHARLWQCRLSDPHPATDHAFGVDAEVFGRDLDKQPPVWLAATLRDRVAKEQNTDRRATAAETAALDLVLGWATGRGVTTDTVRWVQQHAPDLATQLGWEHIQ